MVIFEMPCLVEVVLAESNVGLFNFFFLIKSRMVKEEPEYDDNVVTCSQMVYDCYASEKMNQVRFLFFCSSAPQHIFFM